MRVTQGTLEILGDEAIFEYDANSNELTKVTVHGTPVRFQQQLDEMAHWLLAQVYASFLFR
ncbi:MAG: hypothetical protein CM1200mP40_14110 [Gammaproteobacteria bacterium]|nr:MAG: hypothetical protein CM1200mP40_14110 [Gammaproteobacteria bacterium]